MSPAKKLRGPFREIRAIYDDDKVRVYQAYNDAIADAAVAANSFQGPPPRFIVLLKGK